MRNLKRALSLALASVMLMGMMVVGTSAAAFTDVDANDNVEAIEVVKALGVMVGDENGNFNPDQKVTRNEMAVVIAKLLDLKAEDFKGTTKFTDVPAWADGFVGAIYAEGITAGYDATTFGGSDGVTAAQAGLWVMKALGYFQFDSDYEDDWQMAAVKQASKINLFDGIDTAVTAALTRNEVAQLVLNALKADIVEGEVSGNNTQINAGDVSITVTANVKYNPVTFTAYNYDVTTGTTAGVGTKQLAEKLFEDELTVDTDTLDAFKRPSTTWTLVGSDPIQVADEALLTYTAAVKGGKLYTDLGKPSVTNFWRNENGASGVDEAAKIVSGNTDSFGGNGTTLAVYKLSTGVYRMVEIDTFVSTISAHVDAVKNDDGEITTKEYVTVAGAGNFETTAFTDADATDATVVLYTKAGSDVKSVEAAESKELTATWMNSSSFKAEGNTYKYSATNTSSKIAAGDVTGEVAKVVYFDNYGYVIAVENPSAAAPEYAYVLATDDEANALFESGSTWDAKLLYTDGTIETVKIVDADYNLTGKVVTWTEVKTGADKGKLDLAAAGAVGANATITKNTAELKGAKVNNETIFVVETTTSAGDKVYTVYTGVRNVPALTAPTVAGVADGGIWTVFYAMGATLTSSSSTAEDVIFVKAGASEATDVDGTYYTYKAIVNGEITTIEAAVDTLTTGMVGSITKNEDGRATATTTLSGTDIALVSETGTAVASKGLITLGSTSYIYDDATTVYEISTSGTITASSIGAVKADADDTVIGYTTDGVLSMIVIQKV